MENNLWKRGIVVGIIVLFVGAGVVSGIGDNLSNMSTENLNNGEDKSNEVDGNTLVNPSERIEEQDNPGDPPQPLDAGDWWNIDWEYRKHITIDHTLVDDDLINFPVLISNTSLDFAEHAQPDGDDLVFVSYNNSIQYNHEIEYYNNLTGELIAWVNVMSISDSVNTTIYMYYGNSGCSSQENVAETWDSNYLAVYHMDDKTTSTIDDSTSNSIDGIKEGADNPQEADGIIGKCQDFSSDRIDVAVDLSDYDESFTMEVWVRSTHATDEQKVIEPIDSSFQTMFRDGTILFFTGEHTEIRPTYNTNTWYHVVFVGTSVGHFIYKNGTLASEADNTDKVSITVTNMVIGERPLGGENWQGKMDEIRISKIVRSDAWLNASYRTINNPESFTTIGDEEIGLPSIIYVDDDYNETTPGWGFDHFDSIQDGIDVVAENGTVYVYNGTYYENVIVNKAINLTGEHIGSTIIDGTMNGYTVHITADDVAITGFTLTNGTHGIYQYQSSNCIISGNYINFNRQHGICLWDNCENNMISDNYVDNNTINRPGLGIRASVSCDNNTIVGNTVANHTYGIYIEDGYNNIVYHNNLLDNDLVVGGHPICNGWDNGVNNWYNVTLQEGNYYDDYSGVDNNGDGIGDTPYNISGGSNQDLYPLMYPFGYGLMLRWHLDETSGSNAPDSSGNEYNGTLYNMEDEDWISGRSNNCLIFDGEDEYVMETTAFAGDFEQTDPFSVAFWVNSSGVYNPGHGMYIINKMGYVDTAYRGWGIVWDINNGMSFCLWNDDGIERALATDDPLSTDMWTHVVCTSDGTGIDGMSVYINGFLVDTYVVLDNLGENTIKNNENLTVAKRHMQGMPDTFIGMLDEILVYNTALDAEDVSSLYNSYLGIPDIVYVDDDYNETTPGWGYDHFDSIQDGVDAVAENGTVYVYNGTYYENVVVDKSINLIGENKDTTIIDASGTDNVVYVSANWVNITGFTIQGSGSGYRNAGFDIYSDHCTISGNIICSNKFGIYTSGSSNTILNNSISDNNAYGVGFYTSSDSTIIGNNISSNNLTGIVLDTSCISNVISDNIINSNDEKGISIVNSNNHDNIISGNDISLNGIYGIRIRDSSNNNYIYHNNLINNTQNGDDDGNNFWDDGYPSGGNYWSDYSEDDNYYGPNQDIYGSDGIVDTPYNISGGSNQDMYPLMYPYDSGLVGCWHFDEGLGDILHDSSPYDNNGTIYDAQWTPGISEHGLVFDGEDDYVNCGNDTSLNIPLGSWEAWLKFDDKPSDVDHLMNPIAKAEQYWIHASSDDSIQAKVTVGGTRYIASTDADFIDVNTWYHVVGTYDGDTLKLYVNGDEMDSNLGPSGDIDATNNIFAIGTWSSQIDYFNGIVDEVHIYNIVLSDEEIQAHYESHPNKLPTANFTYTPSLPTTDDLIQFNDTSIDTDGTIVSWWWDFDDTYFSSSQNPTHQYYFDGEYTVTLTVTDSDGATDSIMKTVIVGNAPETPSKPSGRTFIFPRREYIYTTSTTDPDGDPIYYMWDWGDGTNSSWLGPYGSGLIAGASHTWLSGGAYYIRVKARDIYGYESDWSIPLRVNVLMVQQMDIIAIPHE